MSRVIRPWIERTTPTFLTETPAFLSVWLQANCEKSSTENCYTCGCLKYATLLRSISRLSLTLTLVCRFHKPWLCRQLLESNAWHAGIAAVRLSMETPALLQMDAPSSFAHSHCNGRCHTLSRIIPFTCSMESSTLSILLHHRGHQDQSSEILNWTKLMLYFWYHFIDASAKIMIFFHRTKCKIRGGSADARQSLFLLLTWLHSIITHCEPWVLHHHTGNQSLLTGTAHIGEL